MHSGSDHEKNGSHPIFAENLQTREMEPKKILVSDGNEGFKFDNFPDAIKGDKGEPGKDSIEMPHAKNHGKNGNDNIKIENLITEKLNKGFMLVTDGKGGVKFARIPEPEEKEEPLIIDNSVIQDINPFTWELILMGAC